MMVIAAIQKLDMKVHAHAVGNGIEKLPYKLGIQFSDPVYCKVTVKVQIGSATQIYRTENKIGRASCRERV